MNAPSNDLSIAQIQEAIAARNGEWQAAETLHWLLPLDQKRLRLGAVPPSTTTLQAREALARNKVKSQATAAGGTPTAYDWRNVAGIDYITPIKDQGACGSCVAFGSAATIEGTARVLYGASLPIDLSEAQLFYCVAASQGSTCESGWWPDQAFRSFETPGITDEAHFPYTAGDQGCGLQAGWPNVTTRLASWHTLSNIVDMKSWISTRGPLSACFSVYEDFYSYVSGVYSYHTGQLVGGHCISIVGYDDAHGCWICKNSWGSGWGETGFFRIGYGQCGIDAEMWAADSIVIPSAGTVPLYRYWNSKISDHFYTTNWSELGGGNYGWGFEETQCYVYPTQEPGTVPLYRYWNGAIGDHFYTTNWNELGSGRSGYAYEGIQCYVYPSTGRRNAALYRYRSPGGTDHFYTTNYDELGAGNYGWHLEGTQCFVPAGPGATPAASQRSLAPETFRIGEGSADASFEDAPSSFTLEPARPGSELPVA